MRKNIKEYLRKVYNLETEYKKYYYANEMLEESVEEYKNKILNIKKENENKLENEKKRNSDTAEYHFSWISVEPTKPQDNLITQNDLKTNKSALILIILYITLFILFFVVEKINTYWVIVAGLIVLLPYLITNYEQIRKIYKYKKEMYIYKKKLKEYKINEEAYIKRMKKEYFQLKKEIKNTEKEDIRHLNQKIREIYLLKAREYRKMIHAKNKLENLYNKDILNEEYKNICAVSSFLEYFETEKTNTLNGPRGAYKIYEKERTNNLALINFYYYYDNPYELYKEAQINLKKVINKINIYVTRIKQNLEKN